MNKSLLLQKLNKFCPDWIRKPEDSLELKEMLQYILDQVLAGLLKIKIEQLDHDKIIGSVPYEHSTANVVGFMHGGTIFTTGDTLAGTYLWAITDADTYAITTKSEIKYLKPFKQGILRCTVTEKSRQYRKVILEAIFEDGNNEVISIMALDYLLMKT